MAPLTLPSPLFKQWTSLTLDKLAAVVLLECMEESGSVLARSPSSLRRVKNGDRRCESRGMNVYSAEQSLVEVMLLCAL